MEGYCSTGQSPQWAVVPVEEGEEDRPQVTIQNGYKHTLRICINFCFYTATMVARTRLDVTLYVHCLIVITEMECVYCAVRTESLNRTDSAYSIIG
jgi:hypothetical protein